MLLQEGKTGNKRGENNGFWKSVNRLHFPTNHGQGSGFCTITQ